MKYNVGEVVVFEDEIRPTAPGAIHYGRIVGPEDKHEVRQCRTTGLVVVETFRGEYLRRVTDGETIHRRLSTDEVVRIERAGWPPSLSELNQALRLSLN